MCFSLFPTNPSTEWAGINCFHLWNMNGVTSVISVWNIQDLSFQSNCIFWSCDKIYNHTGYFWWMHQTIIRSGWDWEDPCKNVFALTRNPSCCAITSIWIVEWLRTEWWLDLRINNARCCSVCIYSRVSVYGMYRNLILVHPIFMACSRG